MEYCRDLQRSDGDSKPDCGVPVVGDGCEDGEGVFCYGRKITIKKRLNLNVRSGVFSSVFCIYYHLIQDNRIHPHR